MADSASPGVDAVVYQYAHIGPEGQVACLSSSNACITLVGLKRSTQGVSETTCAQSCHLQQPADFIVFSSQSVYDVDAYAQQNWKAPLHSSTQAIDVLITQYVICLVGRGWIDPAHVL